MEMDIPNTWKTVKLDQVFSLNYGKGLSTKELLEEGYDVYGANGIIGKYHQFLHKEPKVII